MTGLGSSRVFSGWAAAAALLIVVLLAYLPALRAGFVWDDDSYLTANPNLQDLRGLGRIWFSPTSSPQYYPLVFTSFWIERRLWGGAPFGYHLVNVLLHAGAALLAWRLLRRAGVGAAWFAASLFALHPVQVESVAWVTERKNVLSAAFCFAAALAYLRYAETPGHRAGARGLVAVWLLFFAALLSKSVTATLPLALALLLWWRRGTVPARDRVALGLLLLPALAFGAQTAWLERTHVGAEGESWALSLPERLLVAGRALWFYLRQLLWPDRLIFIYPRWRPDAADPAQWLWPAAAAAVLAALWALRSRLGRGPLVAALSFAITLSPALGFFNIYPFRFSFVADHFQYLASLSIFSLAAAGVSRAVSRGEPRLRSAAAAGAMLLIAACGILTYRQCGAYADEETLWRDTLAKNPGAWMAHTNLAVYLDRKGRLEEAIQHHREAARLRPDLAGSRNNLAVTLERAGRHEEAIAAYLDALRIEPANADYGRNLANLLAQLGRYPQAEACYREVLRLRPADPAAASNLAHVLIRQGKTVEAEGTLRELLHTNPRQARAWANLGEALRLQGREAEAEEAERRAFELDPGLRRSPTEDRGATQAPAAGR